MSVLTALSRPVDAALDRVRLLLRTFWQWFTAAPRALYATAVVRIAVAAAVLGELLSNIATLPYSYAALWPGQFVTPQTDFVQLWPYSVIWAYAADARVMYVLVALGILSAILLLCGILTRTNILVLLVVWVFLTQVTTLTADQSDNLIRITLTLLLFTRCDSVFSLRRRPTVSGPAASSLHNAAVIAMGAQICLVYASGGFFKASGSAWASGYAIYNPLHVVQFSIWPELSDLITRWGPGVALVTLLTVTVQTFFPVLLLTTWTRRLALVVMTLFHLGIAVLMGLPWFSLSALALDAVFVRDGTWVRFADAVKDASNSMKEGLIHGHKSS